MYEDGGSMDRGLVSCVSELYCVKLRRPADHELESEWHGRTSVGCEWLSNMVPPLPLVRVALVLSG